MSSILGGCKEIQKTFGELINLVTTKFGFSVKSIDE